MRVENRGGAHMRTESNPWRPGKPRPPTNPSLAPNGDPHRRLLPVVDQPARPSRPHREKTLPLARRNKTVRSDPARHHPLEGGSKEFETLGQIQLGHARGFRLKYALQYLGQLATRWCQTSPTKRAKGIIQ